MLARLHYFIGVTPFAQWHDPMNHRFDFPGPQQIEYLAKILMGPHGAADQADLFAEYKADIDLRLRSAGVAHDDDSTAPGDGLHAFGNGGFADIIHHDIHPPSRGKLKNLLDPINLGSIQDNIGPQLLGPF